eukprot:14623139-Alexandrium_andersonii.AAC.1
MDSQGKRKSRRSVAARAVGARLVEGRALELVGVPPHRRLEGVLAADGAPDCAGARDELVAP